jgi:hypothetical protein
MNDDSTCWVISLTTNINNIGCTPYIQNVSITNVCGSVGPVFALAGIIVVNKIQFIDFIYGVLPYKIVSLYIVITIIKHSLASSAL